MKRALLGNPVPGAQVSVVEMPPGGGVELTRLVQGREELWGWHFTVRPSASSACGDLGLAVPVADPHRYNPHEGQAAVKLPNAHLAVVDQAKICDYLLNSTHRDGASKARFFAQFGFRADAWETLAAALKKHGSQNEVVRVKETGFVSIRSSRRVGGPGWAAAARVHRMAGRPRTNSAASDHRLSYGGDTMIREHDCVVLTRGLPDEGLEPGDVGTVVHVHAAGTAYEVEFLTLTGETAAVATVLPEQLRPVGPRDLSHARAMAASGALP